MKIILTTMTLIASNALATTIDTVGENTIVRPFGYRAPRPPATARTIDLGEARFDFRAQQVCGYTDWTTAALVLPRQLLSTNYWKNIGKSAQNEAKAMITAISGALPSMLACNASPSFCAVLNRAEAMAQANLRMTFDTCRVLEKINDTTDSTFQALRGCVQHQVKKEKVSNSVAIERCTVGDKNPSDLSSSDKIGKSIESAKESYTSNTLDKKICEDVHHPQYSSSTHAYTVAERACRWSKEFFPGISIEATAKVRHGGTFGESPAEVLYEKNVEETSQFLFELLDLMHSIRYGLENYEGEGPQPRHVVVNHPHVLDMLGMDENRKIRGFCYNKSDKCKADLSFLPPVYRLSNSGGIPALLVTPSSLYELVDSIAPSTVPSKEYSNGRISHIAMAIEPLIQSTSYINTQDVAKNALHRHQTVCSDSDMQSVPAQEDCRSRVDALKNDLESLRMRNESDKKHLLAQSLFYSELEKIRGMRHRVLEKGPASTPDEIRSPTHTR